ncbi:MAG: GHKL domain-containing protein [Lachnospiraceae bacterium]|nr:GHKL domain-containing protein [Lachnospiraceae bacterium]
MIENEVAVETTAYVLMIIGLVIKGYCFYRLVKPFMRNKKGAAASGGAWFLINLILYEIPFHMEVWVVYGIALFATMLVMCLSDRRNYAQKAFLAGTFFPMRRSTTAMAEILYDHFYSWAAGTNYMLEHPDMWFALWAGASVFHLIFETFFIAGCIWLILKTYSNKQEKMEKGELLMLLIPSVEGAAGYEILQYYRYFYIMEVEGSPGVYDLLLFLYYVISLVILIVFIGLYQSIKEKQEEKLRSRQLEAQVKSIQQHISQVEGLYQNIRSIRHDMANHILTLEGLYAGNRMEEAREYSEDLKAALAGTEGEQSLTGIRSGNPVTDVILLEKKSEAEKKKIRFQSAFYYPEDSNINAFDVSVILNNALQNAVENVNMSREPYIRIRSYRRYNAYMIEVANCFTGNLQWDVESGLPLTSKEGTSAHGYGLSNIRRVAEKYSGDIAIDLKDGEFCLSVMLMLEESGY